MPAFRWGVIGPGHIARTFARDMPVVPDGVIAAVASRRIDRARAYAAEFDVATVHPSYDDLFADESLDAIYVATPHVAHAAVSIAALRAGRPVLCEKPLAPNRAEADGVIAAARETGVFFMEGMWTRFLPVYARIRAWLEAGHIGQPRLLQASFGFRCDGNPAGRLLDPALAGGALLDVGVYPIALAQWVFGGPPETVTAQGHLGDSGVDEQCGLLLGFPGGGLGVVTAAVRTQTQHEAWICGTSGRIRILPPFWRSAGAELWRDMDVIERADEPPRAHGFEYQIEEVQRCVRAGLLESPGVPHADSLDRLAICDQARAQLGLRYPFE